MKLILTNLFRRRGRTLLTMLGVSVGVAAIIILGALAQGLQSGYDSLLTNNRADLILSQPDTLDISLGAVDEEVGEQLLAMSEVSDVSGFIQGYVTADDNLYFFMFGMPTDSFLLERYKIIEGVGIDSREAQTVRGKPAVIGSKASESLNKGVGDTVLFSGSAYTVVGIYETGSSFEDGAGIISLENAQTLLGRLRQVNLFYFQLTDLDLQDRLEERAGRLWPDLELSTTDAYADQQILGDAMQVYVWAIGGLAIVIGGVGMANSQLMSVFERTREIGVLRAIGWSSRRVLGMILGESLLVTLTGGAIGVFLGWLALIGLGSLFSAFGANSDSIGPALISQAVFVVVVLGLVGGWYPARRAARLEPVEALSYEGGSGEKPTRLKFGGMVVQSLVRRTTRTLLTVTAIAITVGAIVALEAVVVGASDQLSGLATGAGGEIMLRQANVSDTSQSIIDVRVGERIEGLPEVHSTSGLTFSAIALPETTLFMIFGYDPNGLPIQRFNIVEGEPLQTNRQIIIGKPAADALNKGPGDTLDLGGSRYKIVGIYETNVGWEGFGGVITMRDGMNFTGKPGKVTMMSVKVNDPDNASQVVDLINTNFGDDVYATLNADFSENLPDFEATNAILGAITFMAILVGGIGILNTMLMAVMERTREIGTLRAMGWRRRGVLSLILQEALLIGAIGGTMGILVGVGLSSLIFLSPAIAAISSPQYTLILFLRAFIVAIALGLIGGIYPAWRATRMQPVEALRYE
ncbi:MAG: ABC transporter permease [Chloroflexi bacterium]|nr:MAG: ABC transporter permease [Chloroflexota bacterium]MBL1193339.1 ABC transporter permease [Chloroflexota bacterium]NOH10631.1 ABC transporter permease [Chloroflexota bacterium]